MNLNMLAIATVLALSGPLALAQSGGNSADATSTSGGATARTRTGETTGIGTPMTNTSGGTTTNATAPSSAGSSDQGTPTVGSRGETGTGTTTRTGGATNR